MIVIKKIVQLRYIVTIGLFLVLHGCENSLLKKQFSNIDPTEIGIDFRNDIQESSYNNILKYEYTYNGAGVAAGDINNDGLADLYFSGNSVSNKLYINKGEWQFEDITNLSGTEGRRDWATGVTMVDVNGDGWIDIYVCYSGNTPGEGYNLPVIKNQPNRANQLFINNGCEPGGVPTFTDKAKEYGVDAIGTFSTQAYFFDYDIDGDLDMFLMNHANMFYAAFFNTSKLRNLRHPYFGNKLFKNEGGKFIEVSQDAGIHGSGLNFGLSASISDINMDNWPDIYVTNDYDEQDFCYINNKDGTFKEVSHEILSHMSKSSMGSDIADINNDGYADILVVDMLPEDNHRQKLLRGQDNYDKFKLAVDSVFHQQYMRNTLQLNRGLGKDSLPRYSEIGQWSGISNTDWSWSSLLVDLDNDGLRDIFITNGYLRDITNLDFINYTADAYSKAAAKGVDIDYLSMIQKLPTTQLKNYVYKNLNGIKFANSTDAWGMEQKTVSNGAAYADFDNDGDYDLVTNNLNDHVSILKNNQNDKSDHSYIKIKLIGNKFNTLGVGAKIWIETDEREIFHEVYNTRGYLSSSEPVLTFGLGASTEIKSLKIRWQDGNFSKTENAKANQLIEIDYANSNSESEINTVAPNQTLLVDETENSGVNFKHLENDYVDFKREKLLHYQLSKLGGKLATGDVNGDGNDDLYLGGAVDQPAELYLGTDGGLFTLSTGQPWAMDSTKDDMESLFFDANGDGYPDLYVVSGGSIFESGSDEYQDRLYLNDGKGQFKKLSNVLPEESISGSCVVAADYDKDGDLDLFVGGRHQGSKYPYNPKSFILRNESVGNKIEFINATKEVNASLENIGMVTSANWTDYNGDGWVDLIIVGEWMAIEVFLNVEGKLIKQNLPSLDKSEGWWTSIKQVDIDGDGDLDFLLGNAGLNSPIKVTVDEPVELFARDFNNDGKLDPILCYYIQGKSYPMHSRDEMLGQMNPLRKKFLDYASYADATIEDIIDKESLSKAFKLEAYVMESCWLENKDGVLELKKLPELAQLSCVNAFVDYDFDKDGKNEIIAGGNFYPFKPQIGMTDASMGTVMHYSNNELVAKQGVLSSLWLTGDIRDMAIVSFNNGEKKVVVSRNNNIASVYKIADELSNNR